MTRRNTPPTGTVVLDSEGLAKAVRRDRYIGRWMALAVDEDLEVVVSAATLVEVIHPRINQAALDWTLSRIVAKPVTAELARHASVLLGHAGLHGHRHAIDAMVAATALTSAGPTAVLTSDPDDLAALCGGQVTLIKV